MKILCISDATDTLIYSTVAPDLYRDVDFVISAGDLPLRYYDYIQTILRKDVYYVYGNHNLEEFDRMMHSSLSSSLTIRNNTLVPSMPLFGGSFADGKILYDKRNDLIIAGLGGSMLYNGGDSQYTEREMKMRIAKMYPKLIYNKKRYGRYLDILITHAPPRGMGDGEDLCHKGFECFLQFMEKFRPKYLLHGHVHLDDLNAPRVTEYKGTKVINIYKNYKRKAWGELLFSTSGVAGFIFYSYVIFAAANMVLLGGNVLTAPFIIIFVVLPFICFLLKEPLTEKLEGKPMTPKEGWPSFIMQGLFEMIATILEYVSNTMSFLRVGGFILSHAGMMLVVMTLVGMTGIAGPVVFVIGNLFVMGLEGLIVGIQTLRLEYYEMFSRYYDGGGKKYVALASVR